MNHNSDITAAKAGSQQNKNKHGGPTMLWLWTRIWLLQTRGQFHISPLNENSQALYFSRYILRVFNERWPVSGLQKLNFFVSSLLKSTSDTTKFTFAVQFCNLLLHNIQLYCALCQDSCILLPNSVPHFCGQFDRYQDICCKAR